MEVKPVAPDEESRQRLPTVFAATDWFTEPELRVEAGVVFLQSRAASDEHPKGAGDPDGPGGNLARIPNASVNKCNLRNFTTNANRSRPRLLHDRTGLNKGAEPPRPLTYSGGKLNHE